MNSIDDSDFELQSKFQHKLDYENILLQQMGRIAQFRSTNNVENYEYAVDTLVFMLPSELRDQALKYKQEHNVMFSRSVDGRNRYDLLWEHINKLLQENNLIYHTKYVKSYS